jgi:hypothetical protein
MKVHGHDGADDTVIRKNNETATPTRHESRLTPTATPGRRNLDNAFH